MGICIALAGNPNCGKTTMFNDLTGANQYVGNWPGVTVEKKEGKYTRDKDVTITDLPGIYSLSPYSPEEIVARDYLLEGGPDAVINLVDATNLERNLYLTSQILNLGVPVVIALNMMDLVEKNGDKIDVDGLSRELGCPIVPTSALKGRGMEDVVKAAIDAARTEKSPASQMKFDAAVEEALVKIEGVLGDKVASNAARWYAIKLFEAEDKTIADLKLSQADLDAISAIRTSIEDKLDDDAESIITAGLDHFAKDRPRGHQPLAGPSHLHRHHVLRVLAGGLRRRRRGDRLGQRRYLRRRLALHRQRRVRRGHRGVRGCSFPGCDLCREHLGRGRGVRAAF